MYCAGLLKGINGTSVEQDMPLMESGLDSLGAVELRNAIAERFSTSLPATITFDYPTLHLLAQFIAAQTFLPSAQVTLAAAPVNKATKAPGVSELYHKQVLATILEAAAEILQAPIGAGEPFMQVCKAHQPTFGFNDHMHLVLNMLTRLCGVQFCHTFVRQVAQSKLRNRISSSLDHTHLPDYVEVCSPASVGHGPKQPHGSSPLRPSTGHALQGAIHTPN